MASSEPTTDAQVAELRARLEAANELLAAVEAWDLEHNPPRHPVPFSRQLGNEIRRHLVVCGHPEMPPTFRSRSRSARR